MNNIVDLLRRLIKLINGLSQVRLMRGSYFDAGGGRENALNVEYPLNSNLISESKVLINMLISSTDLRSARSKNH